MAINKFTHAFYTIDRQTNGWTGPEYDGYFQRKPEATLAEL